MKDVSGYIYVLQDAKAQEYKIGKAATLRNVKQRLSTIQTGRSNTLTLLYTLRVENRHTSERFLHAVFISDKIRGEWFKLTESHKVILDSIFNQTMGIDHLQRIGLVQYG